MELQEIQNALTYSERLMEPTGKIFVRVFGKDYEVDKLQIVIEPKDDEEDGLFPSKRIVLTLKD